MYCYCNSRRAWSRQPQGAAIMPRKGDYHTRTCAVCGKAFRCPPSADTVCCSPACSKAHRQALYASGVYDQNTAKMLTAKEASPLLQPNAQHVNAKSWVICAPNGKVYECRNLLNWCREHADLLPGAPRQAWGGLSKIKYSMQGKRQRNPSKSWKGWTLIDWGD